MAVKVFKKGEVKASAEVKVSAEVQPEKKASILKPGAKKVTKASTPIEAGGLKALKEPPKEIPTQLPNGFAVVGAPALIGMDIANSADATAQVVMVKTANKGIAKDVHETDSNHKVATVFAQEPMGSVTVQMGVTRNLGNFESVKMSVTLNYPSTIKNFDDTFQVAHKWVDDKVNELNAAIDAELS